MHIPYLLLIDAQMETNVWFGAHPQKLRLILCTHQLREVPLWTSCAARDNSDAMTAAPSSVTPVTTLIMKKTALRQARAASASGSQGTDRDQTVAVTVGLATHGAAPATWRLCRCPGTLWLAPTTSGVGLF